ncbi:hypothetical protein GCM10027082_18730 [Comamonas humi]
MAHGVLRGMFKALERMNGVDAAARSPCPSVARAHGVEVAPTVQGFTCTAEELLQAAMCACGYWRDSSQARAQMREEIFEAKPEHRAELMQMFREDYR